MAELDRLLHEPEVATLTGFSPHTLRQWRSLRHRNEAKGPKWGKVGRSVVYLESDVKAWMRRLGRSRSIEKRVNNEPE